MASILLFLIFAVEGEARERRWLGRVEFERAGSWSLGRAPCPGDAVVFPGDLEVALGLPAGQLVLSRLVLPRQGVLRLDGPLVLSDLPSTHPCPPREIKYLMGRVRGWLELDAWSGASRATPHLERVPCLHDTVLFPENSTFAISMPQVPVQVAAFYIDHMRLSYTDWKKVVQSSDREIFKWGGNEEVPLDMNVKIGGEACDECDCDNGYLMESVCSVVACPTAYCFQPIRPAYHCCYICGGLLRYELKKDLVNVSQVRSAVEKYVEQLDLVSHTSVVQQYLQVVIVNSGDFYTNPTEYLNDLNNYILTDSRFSTGLSLVEMSNSEEELSPVSVGRSAVSLVLLLVLAGLAVLGILCYGYDGRLDLPSCRQLSLRVPSASLSFARFENLTSRLELASQPLTKSQHHTAFDNPMYSKGEEDIKEVEEEEEEEEASSAEEEISHETY